MKQITTRYCTLFAVSEKFIVFFKQGTYTVLQNNIIPVGLFGGGA